MTLVLHVVGARPNFMKCAPVMAAMERSGIPQTLVHTGQHYDANLSDIFLQQLGMRHPDVNLEAGSGSHASQTAEIMLRFEPVLKQQQPDLVVVYGDVNSTLACALVAAKEGVPVAHVEAGLRSYDRSMPEEINRIITDHLSNLLFTHSEDADLNLRREGVAADKIHFVGNVMIDTLLALLPLAEERWNKLAAEFRVDERRYGLVTLHRPSNVDNPQKLQRIMQALVEIASSVPLIFPVHPRTAGGVKRTKLQVPTSNLMLISPLGYLDCLALESNAAFVITDSGGIQEETTYLRVPCFTLRENTERPVTIEVGTNLLLPDFDVALGPAVAEVLAGRGKRGTIPTLWDGRAAERISRVVQQYLSHTSTALATSV